MSKGLQIECFEELEEELGREPTESEVQERLEDKHEQILEALFLSWVDTVRKKGVSEEFLDNLFNLKNSFKEWYLYGKNSQERFEMRDL